MSHAIAVIPLGQERIDKDTRMQGWKDERTDGGIEWMDASTQGWMDG